MSMSGGISSIARWFAGAFIPMFARPTAPVGLAWFLHLVLVAAISIGLYYAQPYLPITRNIQHGPLWFRPFWLSALFLLAYALTWSAAWLWGLLAPRQATTEFPDLDSAWGEILAALEKAGIGIADTPLFFVFGEFLAGFEALFRALPNGLIVAGGSAPGSPIRAFANRDGIYLTVSGASLLGYQSWMGTSTGDENTGAVGDSISRSIGVGASIGIDQSVGISIGGSVVGSVGVGGPLNEIQRIIRRARDENRPLNEEEKRRVRELSSGGGGAASKPASPSGPAAGSVLQNPRLVAEATGRLQHVCGLVARARWPLCGANGLLLSIPVAASDRDDGAQQWGLVAREDLIQTQAALRLNFPVYALVGGAENLPGGVTFFERFAADRGSHRLGKGFPLNPDLPPDKVGSEIEKATNWTFGSLLPYWVFKMMRADGTSSSETRDNAGLVRFLVELRRRASRMANLMSRALAFRDDRVPSFGGCYLAVTLPADPNDVKFAKEFFKKVESSQGYVSWTEEAYADDASYRSATRLGYTFLVFLFLGVFALAGYAGYVYFWAK
ncbi:MAG TPA: type VI secretion protein IcmF/TssM N-terminal domain-containing protein [Gemmata sp.]|jgi:hypothetical protein|nr:type VI secretion protein IcmF/TssM N-terminal domain-containing protein [Gemmata sp.]